MAYDFPNSPTSGQTVTGGTGVSYRWDGGKWVATGGAGGVTSFNTRTGAVTLSNTDVTTVLPASSTTPTMDGAAAVGSGTTWARADHVHPVDTSRYAATNPSGYQTAAQVTTTLAPYALTSAVLPLAGGTMTGDITLGSGAVLFERQAALGAGTAIAADSAAVFTKTISGVTTFTVTGTPASGAVSSFMLDLTNGGSAAITWWSGMKWAGGTAPTLTTAGRDLLGFMTYDAGTTWTGMLLAKDAK